MSKTPTQRPVVFTGIKRMIKSVLKVLLRPFRPLVVRVVRICLREEIYRFEFLQKSIRDYEARSRKMAAGAAEQEARAEEMRIRLFRQHEEIQRLKSVCREEQARRRKEMRRAQTLRELLRLAGKNKPCEKESREHNLPDREIREQGEHGVLLQTAPVSSRESSDKRAA